MNLTLDCLDDFYNLAGLFSDLLPEGEHSKCDSQQKRGHTRKCWFETCSSLRITNLNCHSCKDLSPHDLNVSSQREIANYYCLKHTKIKHTLH